MSKRKQQLADQLQERFGHMLNQIDAQKDCVTVQITPANLLEVSHVLRDTEPFKFDQLIDICGVDFSEYGVTEWRTSETSTSGYSRAVEPNETDHYLKWHKSRFASVVHLFSVANNQRMRIHVYLDSKAPVLPTLTGIWASANWFELEAFDLFGIVYEGHPDLRRILTDYGFVGHPFRKDFPLIGEVELRYDATLQRCVYEPVSIQPRTTVPKVIRDDNRYLHSEVLTKSANKEGV